MSQNPRAPAGGYGGPDDRNGPVVRGGGAPIAMPAPGQGGRDGGRPPRGGTDPSTERKQLPPQYQDSYDDDYYGPPTMKPPQHQVDPRGGVQDNRQQQARYDRGGYDDDDAYDEVRRPGPTDSRREGPGKPSHLGRAPGAPSNDNDYWSEQPPQRGEDPRQHAAGQRSDRNPRSGSVPAGDGFGDNVLMTENKLLKDELDEMARHLDVLRNENDSMKDRLSEAKKREDDMKKRGGDGKGGASSAELERLQNELEKKTKQLEKLASKNPQAFKDDAETEELKAKIQALSKENEKLKKGLPHGGSPNQDVDKMNSTLKAKDKLIQEITEEKDELMAILEEDGTAEKFKQMKKKSKDLKKKNEELAHANERLEAELLKVKPDCDVLGKSTKKGCPNCEHSKKAGLSSGSETGSYKMKELPTDLRPLQELVREQESHILDLQREVDTLRHAINDYQKEIERLETQLLEGDELGSTSRQLLLDRKAAMEEDSDLRRDLENTRRKLRSSNRRVAQLEKWLDEIYNDKNFEIVVKGAAFKGRKTTLSLPDIGSGPQGGESTSRKGLSRKPFSTTGLSKSGGLDAKSSRSSFNF